MEEIEDLRRAERNTRLMYQVVVWVSGLTIVAVLVYGLTSSLLSSGAVTEVGATLVNVEFPLPFLAKPVTYLSIASVTFFYSTLRLWESRIARWSRMRLSFMQLFAVVVAFASAYEILYNFTLWGSIYSVQVLQEHIRNPDIIASPSVVPWNLVFATKMFLALFVVSGYTTYFLRRIHRGNGLV